MVTFTVEKVGFKVMSVCVREVRDILSGLKLPLHAHDHTVVMGTQVIRIPAMTDRRISEVLAKKDLEEILQNTFGVIIKDQSIHCHFDETYLDLGIIVIYDTILFSTRKIIKSKNIFHWNHYNFIRDDDGDLAVEGPDSKNQLFFFPITFTLEEIGSRKELNYLINQIEQKFVHLPYVMHNNDALHLFYRSRIAYLCRKFHRTDPIVQALQLESEEEKKLDEQIFKLCAIRSAFSGVHHDVVAGIVTIKVQLTNGQIKEIKTALSESISRGVLLKFYNAKIISLNRAELERNIENNIFKLEYKKT